MSDLGDTCTLTTPAAVFAGLTFSLAAASAALPNWLKLIVTQAEMFDPSPEKKNKKKIKEIEHFNYWRLLFDQCLTFNENINSASVITLTARGGRQKFHAAS